MSNTLQYFSQSGQDYYLNKFVFNEKKGGVFLDIGANDGIRYSNTYFFEKIMQWSGICIEPHPSAFRQLQKNRECILLNCCVSDKVDKVEFLAIEGYSEMLSGILTKYDERHILRVKKELELYGGETQLVEINSITIEKILADYSITKIDYCSIDTEGGELEILQQFDLKKIDIFCFSIENNYGDKKIENYLGQYGYKLVKRCDADEIYIKKNKLFLWFKNLFVI
jgi:FkbM family methyltransferase